MMSKPSARFIAAFLSAPIRRIPALAGPKAEGLYLKRRGAKTYRLLLQVCHSWEVPGEI
jgi:hypothetical protein